MTGGLGGLVDLVVGFNLPVQEKEFEDTKGVDRNH